MKESRGEGLVALTEEGLIGHQGAMQSSRKGCVGIRAVEPAGED